MRIVIAGGSGFLGQYLLPALLADGHELTILTRARVTQEEHTGALLRYVHWEPQQSTDPLAHVLAGTDAVINLAGSNIGSRPWTTRRKANLLQSRLQATETLIQAMERLKAEQRPHTLVNASGIDFYGNRSDEALTESSAPGDTFLARVCQQWEQAAMGAQQLGVRVVLMRTAIVLAPDAITLRLMALPFRLFLGGPTVSGQQFFTWISIEDLIGLYKWALTASFVSGPVNVVAPDILPQEHLALTLGAILKRPARLRTPAPFLRLIMGERADLLLHGRRALPASASTHGYTFQFPELESTLRHCLQGRTLEKRASCPVQARSPFFPVLASVEACLPEALHDQYLLLPTDNYRVILEGAMDRIWHRPFWLWPFFRLLAVFDILFPEQGKNIAASMIVEGLYDPQKGASQTWHRAFVFRKTRRFDALMAFDVRHARMIEHVRPGILEIVWRVSFAAPATISIVTESIRLCIGKWRMALPRWASVEVQVKETALEETDNLISVELVMRHSWLGEIFGYNGRFHVRREQKKEA